MPTYDAVSGLNLEAIKWAIKALNEKAAQYQKARCYYEGKHTLEFITEKFRSAFADNLTSLKANMCPTVVDVPANRLAVKSFSVKQATGAAQVNTDALNGALLDVWELNRMDTRAFNSMREALKCGDSYVIVWPDRNDDGTLDPILFPQAAGTCAVQYHPERPGFITRAAKFWVQDKKVRLNIYTGTEIEKYISLQETKVLPAEATGFEKFVLFDEQGVARESWPLLNPFGKCPVFHFGNGEERKSELVDVIEPQNGLNLTLANLMVAQEFFAYPQRYILGLDPRDTDEDNEAVKEWRAAMDRVWFTKKEPSEVSMGQFATSSPEPYLSVMREFRVLISEISGIPSHYFSMSGSPPSGVALELIESRLSSKVSQRQKSWGNVWADIMLLALKMKGAVKDGDGVRLGTEWEDTKPRDAVAAMSELEAKVRLGVSKEQAQREMGYSETRREEMREETANEANSAGALMGSLFNAGAV